jgi:hypothetical protein
MAQTQRRRSGNFLLLRGGLTPAATEWTSILSAIIAA